MLMTKRLILFVFFASLEPACSKTRMSSNVFLYVKTRLGHKIEHASLRRDDIFAGTILRMRGSSSAEYMKTRQIDRVLTSQFLNKYHNTKLYAWTSNIMSKSKWPVQHYLTKKSRITSKSLNYFHDQHQLFFSCISVTVPCFPRIPFFDFLSLDRCHRIRSPTPLTLPFLF